jgi:O-succinylbenzoic acid--CoA ligase
MIHPRATTAEQARQRALVGDAQLEPDDAVILFTSGSTGIARGVVLSRAAIEAACHASERVLGWCDNDRWLLCVPLAHASGLSIVVRCHLAGKPIVLGDPSAIGHATLASLVPAQLAALLDDPAWRPPAALRAVLLGGAAASPALVADALARGVPILPTYGLTETFGQVATARGPGELPQPLSGVELAAGTSDHPAPIRIRGPMLATRYLDGTPIAPELVTTDLGFLDGGGLHVVGRSDDVIITGGENVHPLEVEAVVAATPGVRAAAAFGVPDPRWGQIVAVALATEASFDRRRAIERWRTELPAHARPRRWVVLPALPVLPSGKLDRRQLARLHASPIEDA